MKRFSFAAQAALSTLFVLGAAAVADAEMLVEYNLDNANQIATGLNPTVLAGTFNPGTGGTLVDGGFMFAETNASSEIEAPYATLSVAALAGSSLNLDRLEFDAKFMGPDGQGTLGVRFVGNGSNFEQQINVTSFPGFNAYSISLAGMSIISDTLKLYLYDHDGGASARVRIDNVRLVGVGGPGEPGEPGDPGDPPDMPHTPEPSTLALVCLGAFGFGASRLRRRRQTEAVDAAV